MIAEDYFEYAFLVDVKLMYFTLKVYGVIMMMFAIGTGLQRLKKSYLLYITDVLVYPMNLLSKQFVISTGTLASIFCTHMGVVFHSPALCLLGIALFPVFFVLLIVQLYRKRSTVNEH